MLVSYHFMQSHSCSHPYSDIVPMLIGLGNGGMLRAQRAPAIALSL
jgi:hypothetical protein